MAFSRRSSGSDREYVLMPVRSVAGGSEFGGRSRRGDRDDRIEVNNFLEVPRARPRASSQGGGVAPTIVNIGTMSDKGKERSRSRHRHRHRSRSRSTDSSSSGSRSHSRSRHHRRPSRRPYADDEEELSYKLRKELDFAKMARKDEEERRIQDRIKKDREEERKRLKLEEDEEHTRKKREREAILLEAKLEEERKKKEQEELRNRILKDEEDRLKKEKEKKEAEEKEFERKVKEKFMNAGYSSEYIEEVLHKKKKERESQSLAIDLHRPTYIKVNRKYLHPDTLDHYGLPWEWDARDDEFIIIKKYVDHTFQDELFEHTRKLKERKLITGPYVKETKTITTLTPNTVRKGDKMYVVREKSKSPARSSSRRTSWMFT